MTVDAQNGLFTEAAAEFEHLVSGTILPNPGRSD